MKLSRRDFESLATEVIDKLPEEVLSWLDNVDIVVEGWPSREDLEPMGMKDRYDLLGLYLGVPLAEREGGYPTLPDKVLLFQGPIEAVGVTREGIRREIRTTILHELAHHLGIGEARLEELGLD